MRKNTEIVFVALSVFLLFVACGDPGYRLHPIGWRPVPDRKWAKQFSDFEAQTRGIEGLTGNWWVDPDVQIYNNTKSISVESAELHTGTETFSAEVYDHNDVPPSASGYHIPVVWKFEQTRAAPKVLGDQCEIVLNLKVGGESRQIKIEYEK